MLDNLKEKDDPQTYSALSRVLESMEKVPTLDDENNFNFNYICVENPTIYQSSPHYTAKPPYWIGKMESVDGFSVGEIEPAPTK